jgi:hypothetical protein
MTEYCAKLCHAVGASANALELSADQNDLMYNSIAVQDANLPPCRFLFFGMVSNECGDISIQPIPIRLSDLESCISLQSEKVPQERYEEV